MGDDAISNRPAMTPAPGDAAANQKLLADDLAQLDQMKKGAEKTLSKDSLTAAQMYDAESYTASEVRDLELSERVLLGLKADKPVLQAALAAGTISQADMKKFDDALAQAQNSVGMAMKVFDKVNQKIADYNTYTAKFDKEVDKIVDKMLNMRGSQLTGKSLSVITFALEHPDLGDPAIVKLLKDNNAYKMLADAQAKLPTPPKGWDEFFKAQGTDVKAKMALTDSAGKPIIPDDIRRPPEEGNPCFGSSSAAFYIALMQIAEIQKENQRLQGPIQVQLRQQQMDVRDSRMTLTTDIGEAEAAKQYMLGVGAVVGGCVNLGCTATGGIVGGEDQRGGMKDGFATGVDIGGKVGSSSQGIITGAFQMAAAHYDTDIAEKRATDIALNDAYDNLKKQSDDSQRSSSNSSDQISQIYQNFTQSSREQHQIRWSQ